MVGKTKKNKWGLHDYWREKLLDKVDLNNAIPSEKGWKDGRDDGGGEIEAIKVKAVDDVDPLLWSESDKAFPMVRKHQHWNCATCGQKWSNSRLVVGPDLVSEVAGQSKCNYRQSECNPLLRNRIQSAEVAFDLPRERAFRGS